MNCSHFATYIFSWPEMASIDIPGGVLWISGDWDDRMGAKIKAQKIPGPKFNPQKIPCRISESQKFPESIK